MVEHNWSRPVPFRFPRTFQDNFLTPVLATGIFLIIMIPLFFLSRQASPAGATSGDLGTWTSTTSLPEPLWAFSALGNTSEIVVFGGERAMGDNVATVRSASINPDGTQVTIPAGALGHLGDSQRVGRSQA